MQTPHQKTLSPAGSGSEVPVIHSCWSCHSCSAIHRLEKGEIEVILVTLVTQSKQLVIISRHAHLGLGSEEVAGATTDNEKGQKRPGALTA